MSVFEVSKFDVAERQLIQSIMLFFTKGDSVSCHTLAETANQVLHDISSDYNIKSFLRNRESLEKEEQKEWFRILFKARNFFKHADKDKNERFTFNTAITPLSIIDSISMHKAIKKKWIPETKAFYTWFCIYHPELLADNSESAKVITEADAQVLSCLPMDFYDPILKMISQLRSEASALEDVTIKYGL